MHFEFEWDMETCEEPRQVDYEALEMAMVKKLKVPEEREFDNTGEAMRFLYEWQKRN